MIGVQRRDEHVSFTKKVFLDSNVNVIRAVTEPNYSRAARRSAG